MARAPTGQSQSARGEPPSEVQITLVYRSRGPTLYDRIRRLGSRSRRRHIIVAGFALALAAAIVLAAGGSARSPAAAPVPQPSAPGPAGVPAAYRYPRDCLTFTIAPADRAYASARLDRASPCWRYGAYVTAIFHRLHGMWQPLIDTAGFSCPIGSVPRLVQTQLGVCAGE